MGGREESEGEKNGEEGGTGWREGGMGRREEFERREEWGGEKNGEEKGMGRRKEWEEGGEEGLGRETQVGKDEIQSKEERNALVWSVIMFGIKYVYMYRQHHIRYSK